MTRNQIYDLYFQYFGPYDNPSSKSIDNFSLFQFRTTLNALFEWIDEEKKEPKLRRKDETQADYELRTTKPEE
jgi:hypothetical protein